jgi:hypothetical protein
MITRLVRGPALGALALLAVSAGAGAMAQTAAGPAPATCATPDAVGRWLHDPQGNTIGSVRALTDGGQSVVVMIGSYFRPGSHEAVVPACAVSVADGRVTLHEERTLQALNTRAVQ